jgi:Predicted phosphatases
MTRNHTTYHIVWDWNGTLFHDIDAVVDATNEVFRPYGLPELDPDGFREVYTRPIWLAYERLLGRSLRDGEWEALDQGFHDHYHRLMLSCRLSQGAEEVLGAWSDAGSTQSLLSMWLHERLVGKVGELGIDRHFTRVDGLRDGKPGGHKAEHMIAHVSAIGIAPERIIVIGDSLDDAHAAQSVGARAILYTGGMTRRSALTASGFPVVDSLSEAIELI